MNRIDERLKAIEDENKIRKLAAAFADICTSGDAERFASLWTADGLWILSAPLSLECKGRESNVELFLKFAADKRFFCQMIHSGIVTISGETATARWILSENAVGQDGSVYQSLATYDDKLVFEAGEWLFHERHCKFLNVSHTDGHK